MGTLKFIEGRQESLCPSCVIPAKAKRVEIQSERVGQKERTIVRCKDCGRVLSQSGLDAAPDSQEPTIDGAWSGVYTYRDTGAPGTDRPPVGFQAVIKTRGADFIGQTTEYALLMDNTTACLTADILSGVLARDMTLRFLKKYNGDRAFTPPIDYRGKLSPDGKTIEGAWSLASGNFGGFKMRRP